MKTAFAILLFVLVYGPVAYLIYEEVTGKRLRLRWWSERKARRSATAGYASTATSQTRSRLSVPTR